MTYIKPTSLTIFVPPRGTPNVMDSVRLTLFVKSTISYYQGVLTERHHGKWCCNDETAERNIPDFHDLPLPQQML